MKIALCFKRTLIAVGVQLADAEKRELVAGLRQNFTIWECFMVNQAIPDAPKKGRWVQLNGRPGQNPFFGKEMLECAKEIREGSAGILPVSRAVSEEK